MRLSPVDASVVLKDKVYEALRSAIISMDIYAEDTDVRLDERRLAEDLGVSRTPIREALSRLEQEGLVCMVPRRGTFVVRKSKLDILQIICVWGALESLAARLGCVHASDDEIAGLRRMFVNLDDPALALAAIDEYSEKNIHFHQSIIRLGKCELLSGIAGGLFIHMQAIRARALREPDRVAESIVSHLHIIEALEQRDAELAEQLVREHTDHLSEHVKEFVNWEH
ncbi:MAG TPA: GntR family transcriptional regulator [Gammaproteobacteria bacterium]|nr:GntR family transcriptional regulator [Gammaproteobacteria bacterium]